MSARTCLHQRLSRIERFGNHAGDYEQVTMDDVRQTIGAGEFKAKCLRLLDEVARRQVAIVITKRGKAVAKLVPIEEKPVDIYGCMAGTARITGDVVGPIAGMEWGGDAENL
jgi:prevent-host-death family protein